jgi:hypothetical protein
MLIVFPQWNANFLGGVLGFLFTVLSPEPRRGSDTKEVFNEQFLNEGIVLCNLCVVKFTWCLPHHFLWSLLVYFWQLCDSALLVTDT